MPHIGDKGRCPCCGKPAHYVSHDGTPGWYHDALIDTQDSADPKAGK